MFCTVRQAGTFYYKLKKLDFQKSFHTKKANVTSSNRFRRAAVVSEGQPGVPRQDDVHVGVCVHWHRHLWLDSDPRLPGLLSNHPAGKGGRILLFAGAGCTPMLVYLPSKFILLKFSTEENCPTGPTEDQFQTQN